MISTTGTDRTSLMKTLLEDIDAGRLDNIPGVKTALEFVGQDLTARLASTVPIRGYMHTGNNHEEMVESARSIAKGMMEGSDGKIARTIFLLGVTETTKYISCEAWKMGLRGVTYMTFAWLESGFESFVYEGGCTVLEQRVSMSNAILTSGLSQVDHGMTLCLCLTLFVDFVTILVIRSDHFEVIRFSLFQSSTFKRPGVHLREICTAPGCLE